MTFALVVTLAGIFFSVATFVASVYAVFKVLQIIGHFEKLLRERVRTESWKR